MAFTTDVTTDVGKVRLLIHDLDIVNPIFAEDDQINAFLDLEEDSIKSAAALALETIAGQQALTLKVVKLLDVNVDGGKVADALLKVAAKLREQDDAGWYGFDFAEQTDNSTFAAEEFLLKQYIEDLA